MRLKFLSVVTMKTVVFWVVTPCSAASGGIPMNFFGMRGMGFQQIQLRTEGRENGDLGAVAS
jgi:hypothetical protein